MWIMNRDRLRSNPRMVKGSKRLNCPGYGTDPWPIGTESLLRGRLLFLVRKKQSLTFGAGNISRNEPRSKGCIEKQKDVSVVRVCRGAIHRAQEGMVYKAKKKISNIKQ